MGKKLLIAGNWKMHKTPSETAQYFERFLPLARGIEGVELLISPFVSIPAAVAASAGEVAIGGQNCHYEREGAFTGEVSPPMLKDAGCSYVILGHSERRRLFGESDEIINKKVLAALREGLRVILCVGETLQEREGGLTFTVVESQLKLALAGAEGALKSVEIAYEPVWAIGTGLAAKPEDAEEVHRFIRSVLEGLNPEAAKEVRILYGGSVKPDNAFDLMSQPNVDGVLVGGASLDPESFARIAKAGQRAAGV